MRGDNKRLSAASLIDDDGKTHFHVIPSRWLQVGSLLMILMVLGAILMTIMMMMNRGDIDALKMKDQQMEVNANVQSDPHR